MLLKALPFALTFVQVPLVLMAATNGGGWILGPFLWGWLVVSLLDRLMSLDTSNMDPDTADNLLFWHKLITWIWVPLQIMLILVCLWQAAIPGHLDTGEAIGLFAALGVATGGIGFTFAHELVHQRNRRERLAGELLLISVGYGHFATEHVLGHHVTVATPSDPASARKGQNFYAFFVGAIVKSVISAWRIEQRQQARRRRPFWNRGNPFWRYGIGILIFAVLSVVIAGPFGLLLWGVQCLSAIYQLEAVNYVEHYGLTRRYLGNGRFERVGTQHSWNAAHRVSNWMLINLQRHSDHHARPDRRFPLLQHHPWARAPQLPFGYPVMVWMSLMPPLWFHIMDPRVDRWRARFYPDIEDWRAYEAGTIGSEGGNGTEGAAARPA